MLKKAILAFALALGATFWSSQGAVAQVEYVRVCDAFGTGYFYNPGTEQCIHASTGQTREINPEGAPHFSGKTAIAKDAEDAAKGAAAAASMSRAYVETGHRFAISGDVAKVGEAGAGSLGAAYRLNENLTVSGSAAFAESDAKAGRAGFNLSW